MFFFQAEDGIRDSPVTGVQTCALPIYLLRCLYKRVDSEKKFLGWKVQLLKDFSKSEDLESPFWDISRVESNALEKKILQLGLFSVDDHQNANTPLREIKRRAEFQAQIDELFN